MKSDLLMKALVSRRGKNFKYDEFIKEAPPEDAQPSADGLAPKPLATTPKDTSPKNEDNPQDAERVLGRKPFDKESPAWAEDTESLSADKGTINEDDDGVDREIGQGLLEERLVRQIENGRKPKSLHDRAQMHIAKLIKRKPEA